MLNPSSEMISRMEKLLERVQAQQEDKPKVIAIHKRPSAQTVKNIEAVAASE